MIAFQVVGVDAPNHAAGGIDDSAFRDGAEQLRPDPAVREHVAPAEGDLSVAEFGCRAEPEPAVVWRLADLDALGDGLAWVGHGGFFAVVTG